MNKQDLRKRVYSYYEKNKNSGKGDTVGHFVKEGESKSTIYSIIARFEAGLTLDRKPGGGRIPKIMTKVNVSKLKRKVNNKTGLSQSMLAKRFKCHQTYIGKTLQHKTNIELRKKEKIPDRTPEQKVKARPKCTTLLRKYKDYAWIMDDESYFTLSHSTINGNNNFYTDDKKQAPPEVRYRTKPKY